MNELKGIEIEIEVNAKDEFCNFWVEARKGQREEDREYAMRWSE
jgi:hypothetical protein